MAGHLDGADAVVFAAGAGPGSGIPRKTTVDRNASVLMADAAEQASVRRFVQISSMGAGAGAGARPRAATDETFAAYLRAKTAAEEDLRRRDLDWTVLRPGGLTNTPGTARLRLAVSVPRGQMSRDDVAAVIVGLVTDARGIGQTLELAGDIGSNTPLGSCGTAPPGRLLEARCQEPGSLMTGQTKLLTTPMSVAAPAAEAAATSSSLSKSPLPLLSNASTAAV